MATRASVTTGSFTGSDAFNITVPTGIVADDIVFIIISQDDASPPTHTVTGFSPLDSQAFAAPDGNKMTLLWKRATGSDSGNYSGNSTSTFPLSYVCWAQSGRDTSNPPTVSKATSTAANASPVSVNASSITALGGDDLSFVSCLDVNGVNRGNGQAAPTSYTEIADVIDGGAGWINIQVCVRDNVSAGATGTVTGTATLSATGAGWVAWLIRTPAASADQDLVAGNPSVTFTAPTASIDIGAVSLSAGSQTVTITAPVASLDASGASQDLAAGNNTVTITAPIGTLSQGVVNLSAGSQTVTITAPAAVINALISLLLGTNAVTFTAPTATLTSGGVSLPAGNQTITFTAPIALLSGGGSPIVSDWWNSLTGNSGHTGGDIREL